MAAVRLAVLLAAGLSGVWPCARADVALRGLPFTRSYPFDEIGHATRGARLGFDSFGRLAVIQEGVYSVLNDTTWIELAGDTGENGVRMANVVKGPDGRFYYGAQGSWGRVRISAEGRLFPEPLVPAEAPDWTRATSFDHVLATAKGIYFAGWNGVAYWSFASKRNRLFRIDSVAEIFRVGETVFVSSHGQPLRRIDGAAGILEKVPEAAFGGVAVDQWTELDGGHSLVYLRDGRLLAFDGHAAVRWGEPQRSRLAGRITAMCRLLDGGVAVAVSGKGLFLLAPDGSPRSVLTTPQYHRITRLAANEPGVLWVGGEDAIEKVLYGNPLTVFGQRLGLPISWPLVARWRDRIVVSSGGQLYQAVAGPPGAPSRFELMTPLPRGGAWAMASNGPSLLVANASGVFEAAPDGHFAPILSPFEVTHLVMTDGGVCYVMGDKAITALRWKEGRWTECAARIPGIGYLPVVHAAKRSAWIELGGNKVARLSLQDGKLELRTFADPAWRNAHWVNVGVVGDTIVLSGSAEGRRFFDEKAGAFRDAAPRLERLFTRSPYWINRIQQDGNGTLWATHSEGVVTFTPTKQGDYRIDASTFDHLSDLYPVVHVLPGNDVWFTGGRSLYHVEPDRAAEPHSLPRPVLVSVVESQSNRELLDSLQPTAPALRLPFNRNGLRLLFFSGTYALRRPPAYEFKLDGGGSWAALAAGSPLSLSGLREGSYHLDTRIAGNPGEATAPAGFDFEILAPWYRTWPAYLVCGVAGLAGVLGLVQWSNARTRRRNLALEQIVRERTGQLEAAMAKLSDETRVAATLAERNRLAGEIHDSLQQGLSGAMLQLDATLRLPTVTEQLRTRLDVVRNMMSFTRHEVQHAVWDMESPLLEGTELGEALRKLTALINSGAVDVEVDISGPPLALPPATKHHLLRIAQEAITNAVRHGHAQQIVIGLQSAADSVVLSVVDNGVGFDPDKVLSQSIGQFGLRGLRGRAKRIQGELLILSSPGCGTLIRVTVPLSKPPAPSNAKNGSI